MPTRNQTKSSFPGRTAQKTLAINSLFFPVRDFLLSFPLPILLNFYDLLPTAAAEAALTKGGGGCLVRRDRGGGGEVGVGEEGEKEGLESFFLSILLPWVGGGGGGEKVLPLRFALVRSFAH